MIKCEVTVCGAISRSASVKQNKNGQQFISFGVTIPIKSRKKDDGSADFELGVTMDGDQRQAAQFTTGRRVLILGVLTLKKKNGKTYFNLKAEGGVELAKSSEPDSIVGTMQFKGKLGPKGVEHKVSDNTKKPYRAFSAWSSDRDGENIDFIWVRFLDFNPCDNDITTSNGYISVTGDLQVEAYQKEISLSCRVKESSPWERTR